LAGEGLPGGLTPRRPPEDPSLPKSTGRPVDRVVVMPSGAVE